MAFYANELLWSVSQQRYIQPGEVIDLSKAAPGDVEILLKQGTVREAADERIPKGKVKTDGAND